MRKSLQTLDVAVLQPTPPGVLFLVGSDVNLADCAGSRRRADFENQWQAGMRKRRYSELLEHLPGNAEEQTIRFVSLDDGNELVCKSILGLIKIQVFSVLPGYPGTGC